VLTVLISLRKHELSKKSNRKQGRLAGLGRSTDNKQRLLKWLNFWSWRRCGCGRRRLWKIRRNCRRRKWWRVGWKNESL